MNELQMGASETRFAEIVWRNEPITSMDLAELCRQQLGWKKTTTYTVLKRLCDKGIFQNQGTVVTSLMSEQEFYARRSAKFVEETFDGSLPAFIAAFAGQKKLSPEELAEIRRMIDEMEGDMPS